MLGWIPPSALDYMHDYTFNPIVSGGGGIEWARLQAVALIESTVEFLVRDQSNENYSAVLPNGTFIIL